MRDSSRRGGGRAGLRAAARRFSGRLGKVLTPLRLSVLVAACAAIALGVSQYVDYRSVVVATPDYANYPDIAPIAPPPEIETEPTGAAHAYVLVPVALAALVSLGFILAGRWRLGRLVAAFGAFAIAIALLVDRPAGLEEGTAVRDFEGARASLDYGFHLELASGAVLVLAGLIAGRHARVERAKPRRRRARRAQSQSPRLRRAPA
jgi:hypothetical protein